MELFHVESPTGKVHLASDGGYKDDKVDPYCNQRQWVGDYWGKAWKKTDKPVTCKRCMASAIKEGIVDPGDIIIQISASLASGVKTTLKMRKEDLHALRKEIDKKLPAAKSQRLTVGCRARFKPEKAKAHSWSEYAGHECLLEERSSGGDFSVMILGKGPNAPLIKKDPNTVIGQVAWVHESELEFVDANFKVNMDFIDWYSEHEEDFCGDCGAWFPEYGSIDPKTHEDRVCPNESCPGRLYDSGHCPHCSKPPEKMVKFNKKDKCPECGFDADLMW
jgi:hypothetical protein